MSSILDDRGIYSVQYHQGNTKGTFHILVLDNGYWALFNTINIPIEEYLDKILQFVTMKRMERMGMVYG